MGVLFNESIVIACLVTTISNGYTVTFDFFENKSTIITKREKRQEYKNSLYTFCHCHIATIIEHYKELERRNIRCILGPLPLTKPRREYPDFPTKVKKAKKQLTVCDAYMN